MGRRRGRWAIVLGTVAVLGAALLGGAPSAHAHQQQRPAHPGEVTAAEDDPEGCETATSEAEDGCGAQGRENFGSAAHVPPVEACADRPTDGGGRITRVLPDGPRHEDGSLAFISGACVYLPPGYATSGLRYPVLYLLHGGGGDQGNWVVMGGVEEILDRAHHRDPSGDLIIVMPDGRSGQWYDYEDGSFRNESYVLEHLIPWVDAHLRTIPTREGRAVAGLSNGGYGALHLAAKRPDRFVAAGGMSSNVGARTMSGLGDAGAVHYQGSVPYQLAPNLDGVDVVLDLGTSCSSDVTVDLCATLLVDLAFLPDHRAFQARMQEVGHAGTFDYRETEGSHAWRWWSRWFEERHLPFLVERLADPSPQTPPEPELPEELRYRSIAPAFEVWGYEVVVDRDVREFLDLRAVRDGGFEIQGSGTAVVTTAARYRPRASYVVDGAGTGTQRLVADDRGRLRITVDLGPSHEHDQFTSPADAQEQLGGYWVTRTVTIREDAPGPAAAAPAAGAATPAPPQGGGAERRGAARTAPPSTPPVAPTTDGAERARPGSAGGEVTPSPTVRTAAASAVRAERAPSAELVPTIVFLALLAAPPVWWIRRRTRAASDPLADTDV